MTTNVTVIDIAAMAGHAGLNAVRLANNENALLRYDELSGTRKSRYKAVVKMLIANPNLTDASIHEFWIEQTSNDSERTHPNRVAYDELPTSQRNKIIAFKRGALDIIRALAS